MVFDPQMISGVYDRYEARDAARQLLNRPHPDRKDPVHPPLQKACLQQPMNATGLCNFDPDRVAMQDATAQNGAAAVHECRKSQSSSSQYGAL